MRNANIGERRDADEDIALRGKPLDVDAREEAHRIANVLGNTRGDAIAHLCLAEAINVVRACCASPWDIVPSDLRRDEINRAALSGTLDGVTLHAVRVRLEGENSSPVEGEVAPPERGDAD